MTKELKVNVIGLGLSLAIALCTVASSYGICKTQIEHNAQQIESVKVENEKQLIQVRTEINQKIESQDARISEQSVILQSINNNLASMNTKVDLLVQGKINTKSN